MNVSDEIRRRLAILQPEKLEVIDQSALHAGHEGAKNGGGHFHVTIVSTMFAGRKSMQRHRLVYEALGAMMKAEIHAMSMKTLTPEEC